MTSQPPPSWSYGAYQTPPPGAAAAPPAPEPPARRSGLRRWGWLIVLVVGSALFWLVERTLVATQNPNFVPSAILLGAAVVPLAFVTFVWGRRLDYTVTVGIVALAAFLGGVVGTVVAGTLEYDVLRGLGALPMAFVGLIEETSKLLVPIALLIFVGRHRVRADGLLIGVAAGAGFAALETMGYAFTTLIQTRGNITDTVDVLLLRGLLSPAAHMAWTGITAATLYAWAASGWKMRSFAWFLGTFVVAVGLHTVWDSVQSRIGTAIVAVVSLILLGISAHRARRRPPAPQLAPPPGPAGP